MYHLIRSIIVFLFTPQEIFLDLDGEDVPEMFYISVGVRYPGAILFFPLPLVLPRKEWDERAEKRFGPRPLGQRIQRWLLAGLRAEAARLVAEHEAEEHQKRVDKFTAHAHDLRERGRITWEQFIGLMRAFEARGLEDHGWNALRHFEGEVHVDVATTPECRSWMNRDQSIQKDKTYGYVARYALDYEPEDPPGETVFNGLTWTTK